MTTRSTNEEERVRTLSFLLFRIRDAIYLASSAQGGGGGGARPSISYITMCDTKGNGF